MARFYVSEHWDFGDGDEYFIVDRIGYVITPEGLLSKEDADAICAEKNRDDAC
jgi:hypothetical protein